jgi:phosphoribosylformylglycinamidine synthase II
MTARAVAMPGDPVIDTRRPRPRLTAEEFATIQRILGRTFRLSPSWASFRSCGRSIARTNPRANICDAARQRPRVVGGPGENAGAIDVGDGWVAVFKIESHNHPSYVEPYQGAATGVGGILRDIFTMGARPVASMDSLKFGSFDHPRTPFLLGGVVGGIGGYGNCVGVPTVAGEVMFDAGYNGNILVNAFSLGLARREDLQSARAQGVGNPVLYVGSATGRDGIHGASLLASAEFDAESESKRPTVQVGDPFTEKLLIEACLEAIKTGAIVAIQDMGAAGLSSSSSEMAGRGGLGIELDLGLGYRCAKPGLTPYEILLSESQERMLIVAVRGRVAELAAVFEKWDLHAVVIGRITDDGRWRVRSGREGRCRRSGRLDQRRRPGVRPSAQAPPPSSTPLKPSSAAGDRLPSGRSGPARSHLESQRRLEANRLSPVRLDRARQHRRRTGQRRGGAAHQGFRARPRA